MTTTAFALPAPIFEPARADYRGEQPRSRKVNFFLEGTETEKGTETSRKAVQVYVGHSKDRKEFWASASQITVTHDSKYPTMSVESFWLYNGVNLARTPVARYSKKALEAFLAEVMEAFPAQVESSEKLQRLFTETEDGPR